MPDRNRLAPSRPTSANAPPVRTFTRREALQWAVALAGLGAGARAALADVADTAPQADDMARFVFVILRGALDGLAAVPPYGDPDYARQRAQLAIAGPEQADGVLRLDSTFGLHPALANLHAAYQANELIVLHAIATPYRDRSHFDGQDVLESGVPVPHASDSGWLNRALLALPPALHVPVERGVALGQNVPLVLRGRAPIASWTPSHRPPVDADTLQRIAARYASDGLLASRLTEALGAEQIAAGSGNAMQAPGVPGHAAGGYLELVHDAAAFLRRPDGPAVAVFDTIGWDTHFNEGGAQGQLRGRLAALDQALGALRSELGPVWGRTVVLAATEFGRTVAINGTRGTDHGTAAAAFLLGGAVAGGRVIADWPGLSAAALYQGRDLQPTRDLRSIIKSVLHDHLRIGSRALDRDVFPASGRYVQDLLRQT